MADGEEHEIEGQRQTWTDDRERRLQALRELATSRAIQNAATAAPRPASAVDAPRPATRQQVVLAVVALTLLVAAVSAGAVHVRSQLSAAQAAPPVHILTPRLHISPAANGIAICGSPQLGASSAVAWSPDGQSIAVLGNADKCAENDPAGYAYQPGVVGIYSAATGALISLLYPDPAIMAGLRLQLPQLPVLAGMDTSRRGDTRHQIITYDSVLWSPDGTRLALLFSVDFIYGVQNQGNGGAQWNTASWFGVATMTPSGGTPVVIGGPAPNFTTGASTVPWEYDLTLQRYLPPPTSPAYAEGGPQTPVGLAYAWNPDGTLTAQQLLTPNGVPRTPRLGPVGNPTHDASFTIWQAGHIGPDAQYGQGVYQLMWQFAAWSPDGRYLMPGPGGIGAGFGELLAPGKSDLTPQDLAGLINPTEAYLPVRDAALGALLRQGMTGQVAWRPDGRRLAVIPEIMHGTNDQGADLAHISIYDCASGGEIARLSMAVSAGDQVFQSALAWSPDGKQLMVFAQVGSGMVVAPATPAITLWRVP